MPEFPLPADAEVWIPKLLADAGLVSSNSEGRRMIAQGAVRIDGEPLDEETVDRPSLVGRVAQVGKRRFVRLT